MAIQIQTQLSKKIPGDIDFSSKQASITITAEVGDLSQVVVEARRLYVLAEEAVDAQLNQVRAPSAAPPRSANSAPSPAPRQQASQPYHASGGQRRGPAPVTDSQIRFLERLIRDSGTDLNALLHHHQIGSLRDLSCKDAAGLIDELKASATGGASR
jgi:hypothetical protein